jgi:NADPH:quinone reductase-like Zn-dependent oxidoreductase
MLRDKAKVQPGEWVLVMGAAGGLGSAAVQAAKYFGARFIADAGADQRVAAALRLGADVGVNYRSGDLTAEVMRVTAGKGADIVLENIGDPELFARAFMSLGRGGRMVTAGAHGGGIVPVNVSHLYVNHITVIGRTGQTAADVNDSLARPDAQGPQQRRQGPPDRDQQAGRRIFAAPAGRWRDRGPPVRPAEQRQSGMDSETARAQEAEGRRRRAGQQDGADRLGRAGAQPSLCRAVGVITARPLKLT